MRKSHKDNNSDDDDVDGEVENPDNDVGGSQPTPSFSFINDKDFKYESNGM